MVGQEKVPAGADDGRESFRVSVAAGPHFGPHRGAPSPVRRAAAAAAMTMPPARGRLTPGRPLADLTWLRVGGPAEWLFQPADADDLAAFLAALPAEVPVFPIGVGSNLIVRDGGLPGITVRLGGAFAAIEVEGGRVRAGAAALDSRVALAAAAAGRDLTFLRTIPGAVGGAVRMNAGCYGTYVSDRLVSVDLIHRNGRAETLPAAALGLGYRSSALPDGAVIVSALLDAPEGDPDALAAAMADQLARRDASQPTRDRTAGSTFRNPAGHSSTGRADDAHDLKAWTLIDRAGMRGARLGGAAMNPMHPNFLTNAGGATAAELEALGERVRAEVERLTGHRLEWEVIRVGTR